MKRNAPSQAARAPFKKPRTTTVKPKSQLQRRIDAVGAKPRMATLPEVKNVDVSNAISIPSATATFGTPVLLNGLDQGAGNSQRIGRRVILKSLLLRWSFSLPSATEANGQLGPVRILIYYDKNPDGLIPGITDVLDNSSINGLTNLGNSDRFIILRDFLIDEKMGFRPDFGLAFNYCGKEFITFGEGMEQQFIGTGATIASIGCGAIYLSYCTTAATINGGNFSRLDFQSRVRYIDP